jgi:hypothetical protein
MVGRPAFEAQVDTQGKSGFQLCWTGAGDDIARLFM